MDNTNYDQLSIPKKYPKNNAFLQEAIFPLIQPQTETFLRVIFHSDYEIHHDKACNSNGWFSRPEIWSRLITIIPFTLNKLKQTERDWIMKKRANENN